MRIGILGHRGRIGACVAAAFEARGHRVVGADAEDSWELALRCDWTISCLPPQLNRLAIREARGAYADLSESLEAARIAAELARRRAGPYLPGCGLAPGAVAVIAAWLIRGEADAVTIYCGALPEDRALGYQVLWSPEGLVGIYTGTCWELEDGAVVRREPLTGCETVEIGGETYEAFRTAGGSGTLPFSFAGKVGRLAYKTLRYPGHLEHAQALLAGGASAFREAFPVRGPDCVVLRVDVRRGVVLERYDAEIRPANGWTAIQRATAESAIAAILATPEERGFVRQEHIAYPRWAMHQSVYP